MGGLVMGNVNIRHACATDIPKISNVLAASWKAAYRDIVADDYLDTLKNDHWIDFLTSNMNGGCGVFAMVMESGQEMIGAAILGKTEKERQASLMSLYLLPNKMGLGFGHSFYGEIERRLKSAGFSSCVVIVLKNNKRAIRFYKAHGFVENGRKSNAVLGERDYPCTILEKDFLSGESLPPRKGVRTDAAGFQKGEKRAK
jgi:ribosomal protein S18 acetylase RimI-like enzyme